ncbi:MAG: hypothetical protein ACFFEK_01570, partial [Candidatus Thorarchaeota archaeon]
QRITSLLKQEASKPSENARPQKILSLIKSDVYEGKLGFGFFSFHVYWIHRRFSTFIYGSLPK